MDQNLPLMAKKIWRIMRVMLKKGISKAKLIADLNIMMKRGKLAGKSLHNLLFHHHHNWAAATFHHPHRHPHHLPFPKSPSTDDDEFSCTTTPQHQNNAPPPRKVVMALEMLKTAAASPVAGKKLRVTDSPFPLSNGGEDGHKVDEDAEDFITRFYNGLEREK